MASELDRQAVIHRYSHHPVLSDVHRLVIFTIPKVASTELLKLARRMTGFRDWRKDPHHLDRPLLCDRTADTIEAVLTAPDWTRAVLLRDPAERLLSAYLNKFTSEDDGTASGLRPDGFGMPFEEFLRCVLTRDTGPSSPYGLHQGSDPHWRPQALVGGLAYHLDDLTEVGDFNQAGEWCHRVLDRVGAWDRFGAWGWGNDATKAIFARNDSIRRTRASELIKRYYDAATLEQVYSAYAIDLDLGCRFGLDLRHHG